MAWVRVESSVARNRKFLEAGPAASWLWLCGLTYAQEGLTDGFIPFQALTMLGVRGAGGLKCKLVAVGLWDEVEGGWQIHDYLNHNRSADHVRSIQHERREAGMNGGKASGEARRANLLQANTKQPSNPSTETETATETKPETGQRPRPSPIVRRRRLDAAWEGPRVYVPQRCHSDFVALRNGAESELFAWYAETSEAWTDGAFKASETGPDMFAFWKARYAEKWPVAKVDKRIPEWAR